MQGLLGRVVDRLQGSRRSGADGPGAIAALDVGTEFAKALVVTTEPGDALMIPGELFAREWFRPYEPGELADVLAEIGG